MRSILLMPLVILAALVSGSTGQIYIDGPVSGDLSPATYFVNKGIVILPGTELTILAGTELRFADSATLDIYGSLVIAGTSSQPVSFSPLDKGPWGGIRLYDGRAGVLLRGVIITRCKTGIYIAAPVDTLRVTFDRCMFRECGSMVRDSRGNELMAGQARAVSGACDYPDGECAILRDFKSAGNGRTDEGIGPRGRGFKLRKPTILEKIFFCATAVFLVTFSVILSQEQQ